MSRDYIENMNMLSGRSSSSATSGGGEWTNFDEEFYQEQNVINANRLGLINALASFRPPESTKTSVYKWYDTLKSHTKHLDDLSANYVNRLQTNYEESNQNIINKMELTLVKKKKKTF
jgi:hypothetical protein